MKFILGEGCTGSGWKEFPEDLTAKEALLLWATSLSDSEADDELMNLVSNRYDECSEGIYCEQCNDTYYEYTLEIGVRR